MKEHIVAFIDILGFSEMVSADCRDPSREFNNLNKLKGVLNKARKDSLSGDLTIVQFSDSVIISKLFSKGVLSDFIGVCARFQAQLFEKGILCRGGVAVGRHFYDQEFMFSEGLIEAYKIESSSARYPRIVVSSDLLELESYPYPSYSHNLLMRE